MTAIAQFITGRVIEMEVISQSVTSGILNPGVVQRFGTGMY